MTATFIHDEAFNRQFADIVESICTIARSCFAEGRSSDARHLLRTAMQLTKLLGEESRQLPLLLIEGEILAVEYFYSNADADDMLQILRRARELAEEADDRKSLAESYHWLGVAHYFVELNASPSVSAGEGSYQEALDCHLRALELRKKLEDERGVSESLFQIGTVYERRQQADRALDYFSRAIRIAVRAGYPNGKVEPARHLAYHALAQGNLGQAVHHARQALELREKSGFKPYLPLDHLLLSEIRFKAGDLESAETHAKKAHALAHEMGYGRAVASALVVLGDILARQGKADRANVKYKAALVLARQLQIPSLLSKVGERLGHNV
jgi:tetratricopeptide (TPR) repeat protein